MAFDPFTADGPAHVLGGEAGALDELQLRLCEAYPRGVIRKLRGGRCGDERALFDEAAAALQLPSYFGMNWNAFDECIAQYALPADRLCVLVGDATKLLTARDAALATLSNIIGGGLAGGRPGKLVYQVAPDQVAAFAERLTRAGAPHLIARS
jgi:hypothetical protein